MPITNYDGQLQTIARNLGEEPELTTTDALLEAIAAGTANVATTDYVQAELEDYATLTDLTDYLPLSGGTMTGNVAFSHTDSRISNSNDDGTMRIFAGNGISNGANLTLAGKTANGRFYLYAQDGTNSPALQGRPDGSLLWNGQPVQTSSDKRLKQDFADVPAKVLDAWGKVEWKQFKFKADVEKKGDSCRWHTGLVAQDVAEISEDLLKYGILCYDKDTDMWTIRYEEALAMEAICQRNRADKLEKRLKALENKVKKLIDQK